LRVLHAVTPRWASERLGIRSLRRSAAATRYGA
jgi:hypothetical protein